MKDIVTVVDYPKVVCSRSIHVVNDDLG